MIRWTTQDFSSCEIILFDTLTVDTCHLFVKTMECTRQRVNPNVNCEFQLIIMYQYQFINCNKYTILMQEVNNEIN